MVKIQLDRPPAEPKKMKLKWALSASCLAIGAFLIILSVYLCHDFRERKARSVTIDAVVTDVKEYYDTDSGTDYDVYVTYEYSGAAYTIKHLTSRDEQWLNRIDETVRITVDSEEPQVQISNLTDGLFFAFFFGMPLFAAGFVLMGLRGRKTYVEAYGKTDEAILADRITDNRRKIFWWMPLLLYSAGEIAWGIYIADIDGISVGSIIIGCMSLPFGIILLVNNIVKYTRIVQDTQKNVRTY